MSRNVLLGLVATIAVILLASTTPATAQDGHQPPEDQPTCPEGWKDTSVGSMAFCSNGGHSTSATRAWGIHNDETRRIARHIAEVRRHVPASQINEEALSDFKRHTYSMFRFLCAARGLALMDDGTCRR